MRQKKEETKHVKGGLLANGALAALFVGPLLWSTWAGPRLVVNLDRLVQVVAVVVVVGCVAAVVWWVRRWLVGGRADVGGGWHLEGREVIAVVPLRGGGASAGWCRTGPRTREG